MTQSIPIQTRFRSLLDARRLKSARLHNGILRFSPDLSYSSGNFSRLREKHALLQFDSANGTTDRYRTISDRTKWDLSNLRGKTVLECGCGAGPDTEILLNAGADVVAVDIAGLDVAARNLGKRNNLLLQADLLDLPLIPGSFDVVFCHRVLQHTPDPAATLQAILRMLKPGGALFVHSYGRTFYQMFRWKYWLRPFTRRIAPEKLYAMVEQSARFWFRVSNFLLRFGRLGKRLVHIFVPFLNYRKKPKFVEQTDEWIIEFGVHDTFDALSPKYDRPLSASRMRSIASNSIEGPFEIEEERSMTLLRTPLAE